MIVTTLTTSLSSNGRVKLNPNWNISKSQLDKVIYFKTFTLSLIALIKINLKFSITPLGSSNFQSRR